MRIRVLGCALLGLLVGCKGSGPRTAPASATEGQEEPAAQGVPCGNNVCAPGMECCNASCGLCVTPGSMCTQQICESQGEPTDAPPPAGPEPAGSMSCDNVRCAQGYHCEMVQVQCVRPPCDPVPECKPDPQGAGPGESAGVTCGKSTCAAGETCCNASCGICTPPGRGCNKMFCADGGTPR